MTKQNYRSEEEIKKAQRNASQDLSAVEYGTVVVDREKYRENKKKQELLIALGLITYFLVGFTLGYFAFKQEAAELAANVCTIVWNGTSALINTGAGAW